jgi:sec-independent protein translocase protein TatC
MSAEVDDKRLPFMEHIRELRSRMISSALAFLIGATIAWYLHDQIYNWLTAPYSSAISALMPEHSTDLSFRGLAEPMVIYLKTALGGGLLLSMPWILLQIWLFVAPGLYRHEKRMAMPFLTFTVVFFAAGVSFCRYIVLQPAMYFLLKIAGPNAEPAIMMQEYYTFTVRLLLVFGLLFELPIVIGFLGVLGMVSARALWKVWRYALLVSFVVGGILTPTPDVITQLALAGPLMFLYFLSIAVVATIERTRRNRAATPPGTAE